MKKRAEHLNDAGKHVLESIRDTFKELMTNTIENVQLELKILVDSVSECLDKYGAETNFDSAKLLLFGPIVPLIIYVVPMLFCDTFQLIS